MRPPYNPNDWNALFEGPVSRTPADRLNLARTVASRLQEFYGPQLLFCALYGSLARDTDGPFSDVELFCALPAGPEPCQVYEWIEGGIKCKVRIYTQAALEEETAMVDAEWPLSHNKIFHHRLLAGSPGLLDRLRGLATGVSDAAFATAITRVYIAEVFELTAKLFNLCRTPGQTPGAVGPVLIRLLEQVAIIVGMAERTCFSTRAHMLNEAASRKTLPGAYPDLCALALDGRWRDTERVGRLVEALWQDLRSFLQSRQLLLPTAIQSF